MKTKNKKKKLEVVPGMVYIRELKEYIPFLKARDKYQCWTTQNGQLVAYGKPRSNKPEVEESSFSIKEEFSEVHELIADFIAKQDRKRGYIRRAGPLRGKKKLAAILREEGYSRTADRIEDNSARDILELGWKLYRKHHPINYDRLELEAAQQHETPTGRRRNKLWGIPVSAIIRFMGKEDFEFDEAKKSLAHLGIQVEDTTIRGQLWCGTQRGKYGKIAQLETWQIEKLFEWQK